MADHSFISYSNADGLEFATKLADELAGGYPSIDVWFDKRELRPGLEWDAQIDAALKGSKILLFVMTADSTSEKSVCKQEWSRALSYKKTVIPLLHDRDVHAPFRLGDRQYIDFTGDFKDALAQLRRHIAWMGSPEGNLQALKDRLADAERDIQRATDENKPRIQVDIDDLHKQIKTQEKIVKDPKAAEEQTKKNIETGLERERQPEKPIIKKSSTKFINPAPGIAPTYFQDRQIETQEVVKFLQDDAQRLMTVIGRGGVGKTAMVCRLLKTLENGTLPDDLGKMKIGGIVYLSEMGSHKINFGNIFADLSKLLPDDIAEDLAGRYKDPQASAESKMNALLSHFQEERILLLLDNFETLIDPKTAQILDSELDEALRALLSGEHHAVNALITTRIAPRELNLFEPGRQRNLSFDEGLESPYAENILREMDSDGKLGLKERSEDDAQLQRAREKTRGYPRALEAFFAILSSDRYTTLEELLEMPLPENVVEALVGEAFSRLDANAQKVMQALAIYNRPVTPAAIDYLLQPHLPEIDSAPILKRLTNMHFARYETGRFYLHPVDYEFALSLIPEENLTAKNAKSAKKNLLIKNSEFKIKNLRTRAADYFAQARKPRAEWKKLADLNAQLAEFDLRCSTGDYDTAASVLTEIDFDYLLLWGHYRLMITFHEKLQGKIKDAWTKRISAANLGSAYYSIGKIPEAISNYQNVLKLAKEDKNKQHEGAILGNLGNAYAALGEARKAIEYYERALVISREIGDRRGEGTRLGNLGNRYADLGEAKKAIEYYEQALVIAREIGDRSGEGSNFGNLGNRYAELGETRKAIEFHEKALTIFYDIGDKRATSIMLENLGHEFLSLMEYQKAEENYQRAIEIADEISILLVQMNARLGLAQTYLFQNDLENTRTIIETVLQYDVPNSNHSASALHGIIALRQEDTESAQAAFRQAIAQADELLAKTPEYYEALDAKGLALCGLALVERGNLTGLNEDTLNLDAVQKNQHSLKEAQGDLSGFIREAIETFQKAREIAPHAGVVKRVLRLFDELAKCDSEGVLEGVRVHVEG